MRASPFQEREVHHDFSRDQLGVMIKQEEKFYRCRDVLSVQGMEPVPGNSPLHFVAECAMLVTDIPSSPVHASSLSASHHRNYNDFVHSPVMASSFPSLTSLIQGPMSTDKGHGPFPPSSRSNTRRTDCPLHPVEAARLIEWRRQMLAWAYSLTDTYSLDREVVAVAFHLLDRFIALEVLSSAEDYAESPIDREDFQLYGMVCMYIAIKTLVPFRKLTTGCIIEMSRGFYTEQHIIEAEAEILKALDWHVNQPTVMDFCRLYLDVFPNSLDDGMMHATCQHLAEMALEDVYFVAKPNSLLALATVLIATQRLGGRLEETERFLENLRGLVTVHSSDFDSLFRRLESLF